MKQPPFASWDQARRFLARTAALTVAWLAISEADVSSLAVGIPLAATGALVSLALLPRALSPVSLTGLARFALFFGIQSFIGGTDVARRALHPRMPLDPSCLWYDLRLSGEGPRVVFANTLSLLPGTLSARFDGDRLEIHALDQAMATTASIALVEERVAALFGQALPRQEVGR